MLSIDKLSLEERKEKAVPEYGKTALFEKKPRNTGGTPVVIKTNVRRLTLKPNTPIFKYCVTVLFVYKNKDGKEAVIEMSKSMKKGTEHESDKSRCQRVYQLAVNRYAQLREGGPYFYDRQHSLYSLTLLKDEEKMSFVVTDGVSRRANFVRAEFKLSKVADSFQSTSNDVKKTFSPAPASIDKTLFEALNIIISGPAFENPAVVTIRNCQHYLYDHSRTGIRELSFQQGGRYAAVGTAKSVKTLQGSPDGEKNVSLFMTTELKTTLFHPDNALLTDILATYPGFKTNLEANSPAANLMCKAFSGVEVWMDYGGGEGDIEESRTVLIRGFGLPANSQSFNKDGKEVTVATHFREAYKITLKFPNLFTILAKGKLGKVINIPAECLRICPNQPVKNGQLVGNEQAELIKMAAAKPQDRKFATDTVVTEVGIASNDIYGFIRVSEPETVTGIVLPKPDIVFGGNKKVVWNDPKKRGVATDFNAVGTYAIPAKLTNWEIVFVKDEGLPDVLRSLLNEMRTSGMTVSDPVITFIQGTASNLQPTFAMAKKAQRQLLFFITKTRYNFHQQLKALEQEYDVLTQDVRFETAQRVPQQAQTRKNIVNKTNMKLGGLNFVIQSMAFKNPRRLIVGFETSTRNGNDGSGIICVGYAGNVMSHPQQFSGGYVFVEKQGDIYGSVIESTLIEMFAKFSANRKTIPDEIFVYFSGVTEGQYGLVNEAYSEAVKNACRKSKTATMRPHITIITASKTHNERLYQSSKNGILNLEPGTVVDHTIVSPVLSEFYLASAVARQGTTKAAKYTVIFSTNTNLNMRQIEELTNDLCFDHQIVFQPVSLPVPLFIAGRYSTRGSANLALKSAIRDKNDDIDFSATNEILGYAKKDLCFTRFNA